MENEIDLGWTRRKFFDAFDVDLAKFRKELAAAPLPDDADSAATKKDYEDEALAQVAASGSFEFTALAIVKNVGGTEASNQAEGAIVNLDWSCGNKRDDLDFPAIGKLEEAPEASALKFGEEGTRVSCLAKLFWFVVVMALEWIAFRVIC